MNEEALKDAYSLFINTGYNKSFDDFKNLISTNHDALKDAYSLFVNTGYNKSFDDFSTLIGVKKKDDTAISAGSTSASTSPQVSSSVSSSSQSIQPSPDMQQSAERFMLQQQEQVQPIQPQPINKQSPQMEQFISEQLLPKEQQGTYYQKPAAVVQQQPQEQQPQNIKEFSQKYFTPEIPKEQYQKEWFPSYDITGEKTYFTENKADEIADPNQYPTANKFLRGLAYMNRTMQMNPTGGTPRVIYEFIDDMAREVASGSKDAAAVTPNFKAMLNYSNMSDEDVRNFIEVNKNVAEAEPSQEMMQFMKSTDEDPSTFNLFKQMALNPTGAIGVGVRSMRAMINPVSVVGGAVGALGGPYAAIGIASGTLDASLSFGQYVKEALGDKPFTKENVKELLQDTEKMNSIRNKALVRGLTVGVFDAFTMKLGGSVGAKMLLKNPANKIGAVAAGTAIESIGGATGEAAAQVLSGEGLNKRDIFLEAIGEMPMGTVSVLSEAIKLPKYHVNGERVSYNTLNNIVETATGDELQKMDIQVSKDQTGIEKKINDKAVTSQIREEVRNSDPNLTDAQVEGITLLEKELRDNQGNTTSVGKEKVQQIKNQINEIKNNKDYAIQEPEAEGGVLRPEQPEVGLQEVGEGDTQGKEAPGPTTQEQVIITDEDKARRQSITDALFIAEELGDDKVMVGDTEMSLQDAKQELADLTLKEEKSKQAPAPAPTAEVAAPAIEAAPTAPAAEQAAAQNFIIEGISADVGGYKTYTEEAKGNDTFLRTEANKNNDQEMTSSNGVGINGKIVEQDTGNGNKNVSLIVTGTSEQEGRLNDHVGRKAYYSVTVSLPSDATVSDNIRQSLIDKAAEIAQESKKTNPSLRGISNSALQKAATIEAVPTAPSAEQAATTTTEQVAPTTTEQVAPAPVAELTIASTSTPSAYAATQGLAEVETMVAEQERTATTKEQKQNVNTRKRIVATAKRAVNTLKSLFPNAEIFIHTDDNAYNKAMETYKGNKNSNGNFARWVDADGKENVRIDINLNTATARTVAHEVAHAVLYKAFRDNPQVYKAFHKKLSAILKADANETLNNFASRYTEADRAEEFIVELAGMLEQNQTSIKPSTFQKIAKLINDVVSKLTNGAVKPFEEAIRTIEDAKDVVAFMSNLADAIREGKAISVEQQDNTNVINDESNPELVNAVENLFTEQKQTDAEFISKASLSDQTPDDIVKRGRANGVSEEAIRKVLENKGIETADIDKALGKVAPAGTKVELSEETLPGYDRMMGEVNGIIEKSKQRGRKIKDILKNVIEYIQGSKVYEDATDVQREQIIRDARNKLGQKEKAAPKKEKVLGKEKKMVTVDDAAALADQIRLEARAAREAKMDLNQWRDLIGKYIGQMQTIGKITTAQAQAIIRKISKLNVDNLAHVEKFIQYMEKVFADAEYDTKLQLARKNIKKLKELANNKKKDVNLTTLAKEFLRVDPSLVEDIDRYNAIAASIIESLQGSKITNKKEAEIEFARMVSQVGVSDYVNREVALQQELQRKIADKIAQEQFGVEEGDLTYDQIQELLAEENEEVVKKYDNIIRAKLKDMFDGLSAIIKSMIEQQEDPFTYERTTFTDSEKKTINNFMSMDINKLSLKEALRAVDSLHNFIVNRSTASMGAIYANYIGNRNISKLIADKVKAKALKLFGSEFAGELMTGSTAQISMVFERLFKSANIGRRVQKMSGLTDAINGFSKAETDTNNIVNEYVDLFYKRKANGEEFNTAFNDTERGMVAFMSRTVFGTKAMIQDVFNARKKIIEDSIKALSKGTSEEARIAELYQKVYDKILADSNNSQEVRDKADPTNIEAVNFWVSQWDSKFDALADISERIYNTILEKFAYYTPDRYGKLVLGGVKETTEEDILASSFINKNGGSITKEAKSLMAAKKQPALPKGRYINLSFDSVNSDAMRDVLVDENTAAPIRQILAFIDSPKLIELIPNNDDRVLLVSRIKLYLQTEKNAIFVENTEVEKAAKIFSKFLNFGASLVLSSLRQAPQQVIPVLVDTFINTGKINFYDYFNVNKYNFMKNSGHSIANRLNMSATDVKRINELLDYAASSKLEKSLEAIAKVNDIYLKAFLAKPDAFAAQSSWLLYYEKSLKKQGVYTNDYYNNPQNEEAADYASFMVDRTQNPSNQAQKGRIFTYKDAGKNAFMRVLFTLASFRMNTTNRIHSDIIALTSKTATFEDRRTHAASLAGAVSGSIIFVALSSYIAYLSKLIIRKLMGRDDDEEEKDKILKKTLKGGTTRLASDILSPVPILDSYINKGINYAYEKYKLNQGVDPKEIESPLYDFEDSKTFGIAGAIYDRAGQLIDVINMVESGEYVDKYGQTHKVTEEDREYLKKYVITPAVLNIPGILPGESETFVRGSIKVAQGGEKEEKEKRKAAIEPPIPAPFKTWSEVERNEPQLYKKLMGPGSPGYKEREALKKAKREEREAKEAARDIQLGYQPKPKGRSGGGFGNWGGSFNENRNKSNNKFGWDNK